MKIGTRIQTKGTRPRWVNYLQRQLPKDAKVIQNSKSLWDSCRECLNSAMPGDTHLLIVQDDVLPCKNFMPAVRFILDIAQNNSQMCGVPISFFTNQEIPPEYNYAALKVWYMAQCYVLPVDFAEHMAKWIDDHVVPSVLNDDERMAIYCYKHGIRPIITNPSLVEHQGWNHTTLSTYKTPLRPDIRMAHRYIGYENSGLDINWTKQDIWIVPHDSPASFQGVTKD